MSRGRVFTRHPGRLLWGQVTPTGCHSAADRHSIETSTPGVLVCAGKSPRPGRFGVKRHHCPLGQSRPSKVSGQAQVRSAGDLDGEGEVARPRRELRTSGPLASVPDIRACAGPGLKLSSELFRSSRLSDDLLGGRQRASPG